MTIPTSSSRGGPLPSLGFKEQLSKWIEPPLTYQFSGEITADKTFVLGAARRDGRVADVVTSIGISGKDDTNDLSYAIDIKINGTSCMTTKPAIAHVSGEASTNKTTEETGDTGITQAVVDGDNNECSAGDVITGFIDLTRTSSPTTEMADITVLVQLDPS